MIVPTNADKILGKISPGLYDKIEERRQKRNILQHNKCHVYQANIKQYQDEWKRLHVHTKDNRIIRDALFIEYPYPTMTAKKSQGQELLILHTYALKQRTTNIFMLVCAFSRYTPRILPTEQSRWVSSHHLLM